MYILSFIISKKKKNSVLSNKLKCKIMKITNPKVTLMNRAFVNCESRMDSQDFSFSLQLLTLQQFYFCKADLFEQISSCRGKKLLLRIVFPRCSFYVIWNSEVWWMESMGARRKCGNALCRASSQRRRKNVRDGKNEMTEFNRGARFVRRRAYRLKYSAVFPATGINCQPRIQIVSNYSLLITLPGNKSTE